MFCYCDPLLYCTRNERPDGNFSGTHATRFKSASEHRRGSCIFCSRQHPLFVVSLCLYFCCFYFFSFETCVCGMRLSHVACYKSAYFVPFNACHSRELSKLFHSRRVVVQRLNSEKYFIYIFDRLPIVQMNGT